MFNFKIERCPHCEGTDFGKGYQASQGSIISFLSMFKSSRVYHIICTNCGAIVHSYVEAPDKFKDKKKV